MSIEKNKIQFRFHALKRMFEREISELDVIHILSSGKNIEEYPSDTPYPSCLKLGFSNHRPIHVVAANTEENITIIITVYEPDLKRWEQCFEKRREK